MHNSLPVMDCNLKHVNGRCGLTPDLPKQKLSMPTINEVRELQRRVAKVNSLLTPLASDGAGFDSHGGSIPEIDVKLAKCIRELNDAAHLAKQIGVTVVTA